ncbi:RNA polymerase sigma factor [Sphaerisporangium dianthi]|uniref:RNA polymerase sigma factor n=1 Tax=Sphaerisporangium dianthi TaxID=1436120 RepID=A0ABV9CR03_9ACTN
MTNEGASVPLPSDDDRENFSTHDLDAKERLQADTELRDALARNGFTGESYAELQDRLARYAYPIVLAWIRSGFIFLKCRELGIGLAASPRPTDEEDQAQLAIDTVAAGLPAFREKALVQGGWRPERGATLTTYFVGGLPYQFANAYRSWLKSKHQTATPDEVPESVPCPRPGPEQIVVQRDEVREGLRTVPSPRTQLALWLTAEGYDQGEIAEILGEGTTRRAVEGMLRRHRLSRRADHEGGGDDNG